ncbi:hypothetical protein G6O67_006925 [Ophiocordyceps sinensis]|uniref:Pinin/SDK/MemA protein domain-containing protein n=2 Tax=Ophiocordyceps sinensis TaxID=72228 RepID=A0A8H4PND7_9HYPO|nr:Pinin/SDK/MemA protein [Ophiocordyceps sinensis CO18]KAF4506889.1 hypothetical protein G6O67_006925 [Ophiocordyceps sinensis]
MATEDEERPVEALAPTSDARGDSPVEDGSRKRKMSSAQGSDDGTAKPSKQACGKPPVGSNSSDRRLAFGRTGQNAEQGRRASAARQEEKMRGKRLFGGLMNTLNQGAGNSQQRRRQEIERRQLKKMQQQTVEDDLKQAEKRAALHSIRMEQQITWDEQVMRSKHAKMLKLAQFLRTHSLPEMYFLPWRLSHRERDLIKAQVRDCKASISRELEDFKERKEQHLKRYGPGWVSNATPAVEPAAGPGPIRHHEAPPPELPTANAAAEGAGKQTTTLLDDMHDELGGVLVEADEDMVIY